MSDPASSNLSRRFPFFGSTQIEILEGDITAPGVDVEAVASTDDNYLTMSSGVARLLADKAGLRYVRDAQARSPIKGGTILVTGSYLLPERGLPVRYVFHGAAVDYDSYDLSPEQIVYRMTVDCLEKAEELGVERILLPAFGTGAAGLAMEVCAQQMCSAIKAYLARECALRAVYIMLYLPPDPSLIPEFRVRNDRFIREANLVLGTPYDPLACSGQTRNFYGRQAVLKRIEDLLASGQEGGKKHAVILGGLGTGKSGVLDQLLHRARQPDSPLAQGRRLINLTFGRVHEETPASFIYRKLLRCLSEGEPDPAMVRTLRRAYARRGMDGKQFHRFLHTHADHYPQVVLLIDDLPRLLSMGANNFWRDLSLLQEHVRLVFTAGDDDPYRALIDQLEAPFKDALEEVHLECVTEDERRKWIDALYQLYLQRPAIQAEHEFLQEEAGRHPYLIALYAYALIEALVRDKLTNPMHPAAYTKRSLERFFQAARNAVAGPRQTFFDRLLASPMDPEERNALQYLAELLDVKEQKRFLLPALQAGDPQAILQLQKLIARENELHPLLSNPALSRLQSWGYLVDTDNLDTAQFMSTPFCWWVTRYFAIGDRAGAERQPLDVEIRLDSPRPGVISVGLRHSRGPRSILAQKELLPEIKAEFQKSFSAYITHEVYPARFTNPGAFQDLESVGNYILAQFTTSAIKSYLQNPAHGSTVLLEIADSLKDIPWELMFETANPREIPFRIGRIIASQQEPHSTRSVVRGAEKVRALLIGDPMDDLGEARNEVEDLAERMRRHPAFEEPDVCIGSAQCQRIALLQALGSGRYGLIHYSGHTRFDGYTSAWQLPGGANITTNLITNALQMAPPALVFSSSCESAVGSEPQPIRYEDQTFDLPSAFLQAGVEAYIGTLWQVNSLAAQQFVQVFYDAFLNEELSLGECLRRAKMACRNPRDRIHWLAFILYGDPYLAPGDLFPALSERED